MSAGVTAVAGAMARGASMADSSAAEAFFGVTGWMEM
jgi:hypothetical protein